MRICISLFTLLLLATLNFGNPGTPLGQILAAYHKANSFYSLPNTTPVTDSQALAGFEWVIRELDRHPDLPGTDTLLFQSWLKKGVLLEVRANYTGAKEAYCKALSFHKENDSLAFVAFVYTGATYYNLNNFDSASYFLLRAESQADRFHDPDDQVRLYNTLGVLYYDNGNYQQGKNYFTRALDIVKGKQPFDTASAVSLQTNIATSFYHLGQFSESLEIYNKILSYRIFPDHIYLNMGFAYASLNRHREALACFRKVNAAKVPGVFNEMGNTLLLLHQPDSAAWFLDQLTSPRNKLKLNDLDLGTNDLYRADLLASRQLYLPSLTSLQKAIIIFSSNFNNEDIFSNPSSFTGTFASYRLFDALLKKAVLFQRLYRAQPKEEYLRASYEAYKTTLALLRYIEKSYDTDDAKIFLKKNNGEVYQGALSVCLQLYNRHPEGNYLEQAFLISEKNKASIITANLKERAFNKIQGKEQELLQRERNIKYNIARLNVKSEEATDKKEVEDIAREKAGYEIELSHLQKELEQNGSYYKLKYDDSSPAIKDLQQRLDNHQALISFYATAEALHAFIVTRSSFDYVRIDSLPQLQHRVEDWLRLLKTTENGRRFTGEVIGSQLYRQLIKPIQAVIPKKDEWIIVPDGFLYFLPFESLPAGPDATTLLETTTISYQFSSRLISAPSASPEKPMQVLAFAPFAGKGAGIDQGGSVRFSRLSASREEIAGLKGKMYIDSQATKEEFLEEINKYPIVHLATHAVSSIDNAAASYIAFFPKKKSPMDDCLFLEELYGLNMNATRLVIISACETGQGELVSNEGVISLARAFAYAGCESTINSLWKADDRATSFILERFHGYLQKGLTKSKALREAKLDYLKSDAVNKSPAFWAHLILIGNTEPLYTSGIRGVWKWGIFVLLAAMLFFIIRRFFVDPGSS
ncbi:MAG TPA: CHAT domain-containing tetratricopeptide repeat protein [Puia sp.]|nr:CHAT domain-containing tetratricopeptide repeat protein [Puia sp.]